MQRYVNAPVENHVGEMISSNITQLKRRTVIVFRKSFLTLNFQVRNILVAASQNHNISMKSFIIIIDVSRQPLLAAKIEKLRQASSVWLDVKCINCIVLKKAKYQVKLFQNNPASLENYGSVQKPHSNYKKTSPSIQLYVYVIIATDYLLNIEMLIFVLISVTVF